MEQVFVVNPKGGCGKTTISTQLASYYANHDRHVLLIDHDAQKSSSDWLASRPNSFAEIQSIVASVGESVPFGEAEIAIHDMPAAWTLDDVDDIIHKEDKVLIPVLASPNDIKACIRFLMGLERTGILENLSQVGIIANRARAYTSYAKVLDTFLDRIELPLVGCIRDTQNYVRSMDRGLSLFDLPPGRVKLDLAQWEPIFDWLDA